MTKTQKSFGELLRQRRLARNFSLRRFAVLVGVSPTYLSQVEKGNCDPPTAERVQRMAELLSENSDEWTALAGRVPTDLPAIIRRQPTPIAAVLREASDLTPEQLRKLTAYARRLKEESRK